MTESSNALRWDGGPGHYEVWYLTLTDPVTGIGVWLRHTLLAPLHGPAEGALWLVAMAPDGDRFARKATSPAAGLEADARPFRLTLGGADLTDRGAAGAIGSDAAWELSWQPRLAPYAFVHPLLARAGVAETELVLPHADLRSAGPCGSAGAGSSSTARAAARRTCGHAPRRALGLGALQRPPRRRRRPRPGHVRRRASRSTSRASGGPSGRARPSSGGSGARTSSRPTRWRSSGPAAASA